MRRILIVAIFALVLTRAYADDLDRIGKLPKEYQSLAISCTGNDCCLSSVEEMAKHGYKLAKDGKDLTKASCPKGYQKDLFRCPGTLVWCVSNEQYNEQYLKIWRN